MSVLVYTENWEGKFKKQSYELVSYASAMADQVRTNVVAVSVGKADETELARLGNYGASKIINLTGDHFKTLDNQVYTDALAEIALKEGAEVIIFANNNSGKAIAPRLSVRLKAGLASGVSGLPLSLEPFVLRKRAYSGNAFAHVTIKSPIRIISILQNSFEINERPTGAVPEIIAAATPGAAGRTVVTDTFRQTGKILLTDADIVVSGGRGMKSPENWGPIEELAALLGGATACSRPVSDEGWRSHEEHTGQTGKIIAPNLYIAVGISGATQHLAGVSGSKYIVAINSDKDAPIFESAQYGIVGDAMKVLPKIVEAARSLKK